MIKIKRIYDPASPQDGKRILVDRLWQRGIKKEEVKIVEWLKDIAPSNELRKWFSHEPSKWCEFNKRRDTSIPYVSGCTMHRAGKYPASAFDEDICPACFQKYSACIFCLEVSTPHFSMSHRGE